jgi:hypothetical protein
MKKSTFASDYGHNPVAGQDFDPDKISSQEDYDYLTPTEPIKKIQTLVSENGTQKAVAEMLNISPAYLNDILLGRKAISDRMARRLGYRRIISFEKLPGPADADRPALVTVQR